MKAIYIHDDGKETLLSADAKEGFDLLVIDEYSVKEYGKRLGYENPDQFWSWVCTSPEVMDLAWTVSAVRHGQTLTKVVTQVLPVKNGSAFLGFVVVTDDGVHHEVDVQPQRAKDFSKTGDEVTIDLVPARALEEALFGPRTRDNMRATDGGLDFTVLEGLI